MDENADGSTIAAVATENSTEVTVDDDRFEVADGNLKLKDGTSLDFESDTSPIEVTLTAVSEGDDATATVSVSINDVNEGPSIDVRDGEEVPGHPGVISSLTIDENATNADAPPLALIEVMDPDAADADMLRDAAGVAATSVSDDRFAVILDPEKGLWLHLADDAYLNYEDASEVTVTVTFTDSAGNSASQDVTVMVNDVNETPVAAGTVDNVAAEAGKRTDVEIDLAALFNDPDGSDDIVRWELSGNPDWLSLSVEYVTDANGNENAVGRLRGTPPTRGPESAASNMVTLTATDSGGESGSVSFYVVVDDGNDAPTGINLINDAGQSVVEVEVDEGDASGVVFGEITVDDIDDQMHPHGQHLITVSDDRFEIREDAGRKWLALKEGESLDRERESGNEVLVTLQAIDINGEKDEDDAYTGLKSSPVTFAVVINDQPDAPRAGEIGNWWVTVDDRLERDDVSAGDWLRFSLETSGRFAAFKDQDLSAGDSLTYEISGPTWLQIDEDTGEITNKENTIPTRGVHRVTVKATDEDGQSASKSFNLNVALSREDDGTLTLDNHRPDVRGTSGQDYDEGSGEQRLATVRVEDRDQDIPDHQFALKTVKIIAITNPGNANDPNNVMLRDHDSNPDTPMRLWTVAKGTDNANVDPGDATTPGDDAGYAAAIELSDPIKSGNTWTFHIEAVNTSTNPLWDTTWLLDFEGNTSVQAQGVAVPVAVPSLNIRVAAIDGTASTLLKFASDGTTVSTDANGIVEVNDDGDHYDIRIDIDDVNEAPFAPRASSTNSNAAVTAPPVAGAHLAAEQQADGVKLLYINLYDLWTDWDAGDDDASLTYRASSSVSWIKIKYGPARWRELLADGVTWNGADSTENEVASTIGADPGAGSSTMVVVVEIDRTERHNRGDEGSFTLTAEDRDGAIGSRTYTVTPTDESTDIASNAVTIAGGVREDGTLRANFDDNEDPDLAGSLTPAVVLYTWYRVEADADGDPTGTPAAIRQTTSNTYIPVQDDVGHFIGVVVNYYETTPLVLGTPRTGEQLDGNEITTVNLVTLVGDDTNDPNAKAAITSGVVANTPDRGTADITILADGDNLTVLNTGGVTGDVSAAGATRNLTNVRVVDGDYPTVRGVSVVPDGDSVTVDSAVRDDSSLDSWVTISWEVSENGRGGWTTVEDFDDDDHTLRVGDGEGKYYRAVVSYNVEPAGVDNEDTPAPAKESVYSDPIQVADVRDDDSPVPTPRPTINGNPYPGGTLSVDAGRATVTVQWQIREVATLDSATPPAPASYDWVDIPGATGDLRLTQDHAGETVRAVVSYQSGDPDNPGVTNVVIAGEAVDVNLDGDSVTTTRDTTGALTADDREIAIGGTPSSVRPVRVDDYEIEGSVEGTGHGAVNGLLAGHNATITGTVPLASLFQDPDTPSFVLTFGATSLVRPVASGDINLVATATTQTDRTYVYEQPNTVEGGGGVLIFEARNGKLTYLSDQYRGHDGDPTDGAGNVLKLNITADDPGPGDVATSAVTLRINVAPDDIHFDQSTATPEDDSIISVYTPTADTADDAARISGITVKERVEATGNEVLAGIDVQDENFDGAPGVPGHKFGVHEVTVTGDDRFVITKNGGPTAPRDRDNNGSTWELRLKEGATFDYETESDADPEVAGKQIELTFMATDGGGLSTPDATGPFPLGNGHLPIKLVITVVDDSTDNPPGPTQTPGLEDDETGDTDDTTDGGDDGDADRDTDGGDPTPPPPGMSLGGIIEDFIDNMDQGEQDLLEDYLLTIDDGLDIV